MGTPNSAYIAIVIISGVLSVFLGLYAYWNRQRFSGSRLFIPQSIASAIYIFGFAFELAGDSLAEIKWWIVVEYAGMPFVPPLSLMLVMSYVGFERFLTRKTVIAFLVIPAITFLMVATNEAHHLFYRSVYFREGTAAPMVDVVFGEWYIVNGSYTFACLIGGVILLLRQWMRAKSTYRKQIATMLIGLLLPVIASFLYLMGVTPDGMDTVPIIMSVTSSLYIWAIFSSDLLTVVPIARDSLFESMRDGVLVFDSRGRLVDYNRAAASIVPSLNEASIGRMPEQVRAADGSPAFPEALFHDDPSDGSEREMEWVRGNQTFWYQVRVSNIRKGDGQQAGKLIVLLDVTEQKLLRDQLVKLAHYDGLTEIFNRAHFLSKSKELLEAASQSGEPLSVVLFDIDHFKNINDTYGHDTGDLAIRHVVSVCKRLLGSNDLFGRYGGEEFVLCLPQTNLAQAGEIAETIRAKIKASPIPASEGTLPVSASFGVAELAANTDSLKELLRKADQALYEAKRSGRNAVRLVKSRS